MSHGVSEQARPAPRIFEDTDSTRSRLYSSLRQASPDQFDALLCRQETDMGSSRSTTNGKRLLPTPGFEPDVKSLGHQYVSNSDKPPGVVENFTKSISRPRRGVRTKAGATFPEGGFEPGTQTHANMSSASRLLREFGVLPLCVVVMGI